MSPPSDVNSPFHNDKQDPAEVTGLGITNHETYMSSRHVFESRPSGYEKPKPSSNTVLTLQQEHQLQQQDGSRYLEAPPFHLPDRPLSPDALSNLSIDEYEQLRPQRSLSPSPFPRTGKAHGGRRQSWRGKVRGVWTRNLGLLYMVVAMLFGSLMNVTTRMLEIEGNGGKGLHPFQILFARMSITVVLAMIYMWWTKTPHFPLGDPAVRWLLVARGMGGFFGVFGMYYSLLYLPMADATVITFLAPSLSCWACSFLIDQPFTLTEKYGSLVAFLGVIFIARPTSLLSGSSDSTPLTPPAGSTTDAFPTPFNTTMTPGVGGSGIPDASNYADVTPSQRLLAVGLALVGVFGSVCAFTTIRWIGRRAHPLISVNYFAVWCTIVSTIAQLTLPGVGFLLPNGGREWGLLIGLGTCGFIMQFLLAAGLSYEKSSRATNMTYTSMLYALFFDKVVFGQTPGVWSIVGSTLILGSAVYMALQRDVATNKGGKNEGRAEGDEDGMIGDAEEEVGLMNHVGDEGEEGSPVREDVELRSLR